MCPARHARPFKNGMPEWNHVSKHIETKGRNIWTAFPWFWSGEKNIQWLGRGRREGWKRASERSAMGTETRGAVCAFYLLFDLQSLSASLAETVSLYFLNLFKICIGELLLCNSHSLTYKQNQNNHQCQIIVLCHDNTNNVCSLSNTTP